MLITMTPFEMNAVVAAIKAQLTALTGSNIHLFQNNIVPSNLDTLATYTEATFDGYVAKNIAVMFGPARQPDGSFQTFVYDVWSMTGSTTPNVIYGAYVTEPGGALILADRFPAPINMVDAFSVLTTQLHLGIAQNGLVGDIDPEP